MQFKPGDRVRTSDNKTGIIIQVDGNLICVRRFIPLELWYSNGTWELDPNPIDSAEGLQQPRE